MYSQLVSRNIDPQTEFLVTSGAYEALFSCITGHIDVGDEVIIIEPFFDCYEPMVKSAGGICRFIPLRLVTINKLIRTKKQAIIANNHFREKLQEE